MDDLAATAGLTFRDRAVLVDDVLVLADLHLGQAEASRVDLPVGNGRDVRERLGALLDATEPSTVVVAGDLLHSFDTVPFAVTRTLEGLVDVVRQRDVDPVALEGNHDTMLETVWDGEIRGEYRVGDTVVCHGHVEPEAEAGRYVVGHDHPTIEVENRRRPCYLVGDDQYRAASVVVLPSFSRLPRGVAVNDMTARDFQSPLVTDVDSLAPIVWDADAGETLTFPPLESFRHRL